MDEDTHSTQSASGELIEHPTCERTPQMIANIMLAKNPEAMIILTISRNDEGGLSLDFCKSDRLKLSDMLALSKILDFECDYEITCARNSSQLHHVAQAMSAELQPPAKLQDPEQAGADIAPPADSERVYSNIIPLTKPPKNQG